MKQPIKMTPGDDTHLSMLMAPCNLNFFVGKDREDLLAYGRAAFEAGKASQCLHQIQEPAAAEQAAWHAGLDEGRAQAAQPEDARELVTLALGLSLPPKGGPSFAWSYLLSSIRELVKCEEELTLLKAGMEMSKAAPAAVAALLEALESIVDVCEGHDFDGAPSDAHMEKARSAISAYRATLAATPAAVPAVPKWIDDPHDIEQGQMLNPEWVRQQQPAIMPKGESAAAQLRAMATNYPPGHSWDKLDAKACIRGALEIEALRALLATATGLPAQAVPLKLIEAINTACGGNEWQGDALATDLLQPACRAIASLAPQAQADTREAEQEKPPAGRYVLAWMEGREIPIRAMWVPKSWLVAGDECPEGWAEYDEEKDEYYCPEGWYEANEHEETHWHVSTPIVAWVELPRRAAIAAAKGE